MINFYDLYWKQKHTDILSDFSYKWPAIKRFLPNQEKIKILDYGCGTSETFKEIVKRNPNSVIYGADISPYAIKRVSKMYPKIKFYLVKDGSKLPIKSNNIDFITALDVIEHVVDTDLLLSEFNRVLKPNGKLFISTPYHGVIKNVVLSLLNFEIVFNPYGPHIRFFTKKSLVEGVQRHKFKIKDFGYYGRFYPLWKGMFVLLQKSRK